MLPNFLLIGPGRSGSDWTVKNLQLHPQIFIPKQKSTRFFTDNFQRGTEWYEAFFAGRSEPRIGEASVGYVHRAEAASRIRSVLPEVKLIANLRHPVDRAFSNHGRLRSVAEAGSPAALLSFEERLKASPQLIENGLYATHLKRYYDLFPREDMLLLFFDDMVRDPRGYLASIYRFLGVRDDFESPILGQRLNSTDALSIRSRAPFRYYLYRGLVKFNLFKTAEALVAGQPKPKREALDPAFRRNLIERYFIRDIEELERLSGKDLSTWK
jgi:hypothetical protein